MFYYFLNMIAAPEYDHVIMTTLPMYLSTDQTNSDLTVKWLWPMNHSDLSDCLRFDSYTYKILTSDCHVKFTATS